MPENIELMLPDRFNFKEIPHFVLALGWHVDVERNQNE